MRQKFNHGQSPWAKAFIAILLLNITIITQAQRQRGSNPVTPVRIGSTTLNFGVGIGAEYEGDYYRSAFGTKIAVEWGLWKAGPGVITLGAGVGGSFSSRGYRESYRTRTVIASIRSAWHYGWKVPGLDTYAGLSAGIGFHHYEYKDNGDFDSNKVIPVPGAFIGASYFITPRFGFNVEAGHDITALQIGMIVKLK